MNLRSFTAKEYLIVKAHGDSFIEDLRSDPLKIMLLCFLKVAEGFKTTLNSPRKEIQRQHRGSHHIARRGGSIRCDPEVAPPLIGKTLAG